MKRQVNIIEDNMHLTKDVSRFYVVYIPKFCFLEILINWSIFQVFFFNIFQQVFFQYATFKLPIKRGVFFA